MGLSACLSVRVHISGTTTVTARPSFSEFSTHMTHATPGFGSPRVTLAVSRGEDPVQVVLAGPQNVMSIMMDWSTA